MARTTLLILLARHAQIVCGILVLGFAVAVKTNYEHYYGYKHHPIQFVTIFTGALIALFGAFGLFVHKRSVDGAKPSMFIIFIDSCALSLCWGTGIALTFQAVSFQWVDDRYVGPGGLLYAPCAISYLGGFVVLALVVWNILLRAQPYRAPQSIDSGSKDALEPVPYDNAYEHRYDVPAYAAPEQAQGPYRKGDVKSSFSSRTNSVLSGADTITYPNTGSSKIDKS